LGPNTSFVIAIFGVFGIYGELVRPGRIVPGVLGATSLLAGSYFLWRNSPAVLGIALTGGAAVLFAIELFLPVGGSAGALGTAALAFGACKLFARPPWIVPVIGIPLSIVFGAVTTFLACTSKRARRNKWSDLRE
jgi:membrane-bound serine protease (ClpP class)